MPLNAADLERPVYVWVAQRAKKVRGRPTTSWVPMIDGHAKKDVHPIKIAPSKRLDRTATIRLGATYSSGGYAGQLLVAMPVVTLIAQMMTTYARRKCFHPENFGLVRKLRPISERTEYSQLWSSYTSTNAKVQTQFVKMVTLEDASRDAWYAPGADPNKYGTYFMVPVVAFQEGEQVDAWVLKQVGVHEAVRVMGWPNEKGIREACQIVLNDDGNGTVMAVLGNRNSRDMQDALRFDEQLQDARQFFHPAAKRLSPAAVNNTVRTLAREISSDVTSRVAMHHVKADRNGDDIPSLKAIPAASMIYVGTRDYGFQSGSMLKRYYLPMDSDIEKAAGRAFSGGQQGKLVKVELTESSDAERYQYWVTRDPEAFIRYFQPVFMRGSAPHSFDVL